MKKIAIIGMGKMGSKYAKMILENQELGYILVASTRINNENGEEKQCACQIKYSRDGSPESQAYVWPEQCYQLPQKLILLSVYASFLNL